MSEFGSFTQRPGTNPTRRELAAEALLVGDGADRNASDSSGVCGWRERLLAEARREARQLLCAITCHAEILLNRANNLSDRLASARVVPRCSTIILTGTRVGTNMLSHVVPSCSKEA